MNRIYFTVDGKPKPQKRHRTNQGRTYDPSAQDKREFYLQSRQYAPKEPIVGPVLLYVVFYMPVPKGAARALRVDVQSEDGFSTTPGGTSGRMCDAYTGAAMPLARIFHTKRPDVDNLLKLVKDSLTGLFWVDDSQVQIGGCFKIYSHSPRTVIELFWG